MNHGLGAAEFVRRWARRGVTVPGYFVAGAAVVATLPLSLLGAAVRDVLKRSQWAAVRCVLFLTLYLICECAGVVASFLIWIFGGAWSGRRAPAYVAANYALQRWWAGMLFRGALRVFRLTLSVDGAAGLDAGPLILFLRHTSLPDVILPSALFILPHRRRIRHVMKTELLWDPCLDIVGHRIPNCFVRRGSAESAREIEKVRLLMEGLGPRDGVMIYPEGTRFTEQKKARALQHLRSKSEARILAKASALRHVLPPRLGGSLALLAENRGATAVFCAHVGFESVGKARDLLNGSLIGKVIFVKLWGIPFAEIPRDRERQVDWFYDNWARVDEWIELHSRNEGTEDDTAVSGNTLTVSAGEC